MDLFLQHKIKLNKIPRGIRQQVKLKIAFTLLINIINIMLQIEHLNFTTKHRETISQ